MTTKVCFILAKNPAWWGLGARIIEWAEGIDYSHSMLKSLPACLYAYTTMLLIQARLEH